MPPRSGTGGGPGGDPGGGGGAEGGQDIASLVARITGDASEIVAAYQEAEQAGAQASQQTQQYLNAIGQAFEAAGDRGDVITQVFLEVGRAVLESGRNFNQAAQAMRSVGDGARYAQDLVRTLRDDVTRLGQSEESATRTTAEFYRQLERRPNVQEQPQYREVRTGPDQTRFQRIVPGERAQFVSAAEAQAAQQAALTAPENQTRLNAARRDEQNRYQELMRQSQQAAEREALRGARTPAGMPGPTAAAGAALVGEAVQREREEQEQRQAEAARSLSEATRDRAQRERGATSEPAGANAVADQVQAAFGGLAEGLRRAAQERAAAEPREAHERPEPPERRERRGEVPEEPEAARTTRELSQATRERREEEQRTVQSSRDLANAERTRRTAQATPAPGEVPTELPPGMPPFVPFAPGQARQRYLAEQRQRQQAQAQAERERQQAMAESQAQAERDARLRGAEFQRISTGQTVRPFGARRRGGGGGGGEGGDGGGDGFDPFGAVNQFSQPIRLGAGLLGIPLGINIIAGAARDLHDWLARSAEEAEAITRTAHDLGTVFGGVTGSVQRFSGALEEAQNFRLSNIQAAVQQTQELGRAFQFTDQQMQDVVEQTAQLARIHEQQNQALPGLQAQVVQAIQGGGEVPELGINLTNQYLERQRGIPISQMTPEQAAQARLAQFNVERQQQLAQQTAAGQQPGQGDVNYEARQQREAAQEQAGRPFGQFLSAAGRVLDQFATRLLRGVAGDQSPAALGRQQYLQQQGVNEVPVLTPEGVPTGQMQLYRAGETTPLPPEEQQRLLAEAEQAAGEAAQRAAEAEDQHAQAMQHEAEAAASSVTVLQRAQGEISRTLQDISTTILQPGQQAAQLGNLARGPTPANVPPAGVAAYAQGQAAQSVAQQQAAQQARTVSQREGPGQPSTGLGDTLRQEVEAARDAEGVDSQRYRDAVELLQVHERDLQYYQGTAELERANMAIQIAQGEAQSRANQVAFAERARELQAANAIAEARTRVLEAERELAPLQLQQQRSQYETSVASRTNLADEENLLRVRQQGLAVTDAQQDVTHQLNAAQAEASALMARILRGGQVDPNQFRTLLQQAREATLRQAELGPQAEQQRYAEQVAQRPVTAEEIQRQEVLNTLEGQRRSLEDALFVQQDKERVAQNEADELQRQLDISRLQDEPLRTAAGLAQLEADRWKDSADAAQRQLDAMRNMIDYWNPLVAAAEAYAAALNGAQPAQPQQQQDQGANQPPGPPPGPPTIADQAERQNRVQYAPGTPNAPVTAPLQAGINPNAPVTAPLVYGQPPAAPAAQPAVPVVSIVPPGQLGGVSVAVNLQGATINNQDDIERISNQAAAAAREQTRTQLIAALNGAQPTVSPSLAGAGGGR